MWWELACKLMHVIHAHKEVANGIRKIQGLGNFCSNLEISEEFWMSLEISFSCVSLRLGLSNFWQRGLGVSDFCFFLPTVSIKTMIKLFSRVFKSKISRHGVTFWNSWLIDLILFIEYRVAHCHVSLRTVLETGSDFRKMKSRVRFSWYRVSGSDFVKAFKSRSRIFKQGSRRLGESQILPFATPT